MDVEVTDGSSRAFGNTIEGREHDGRDVKAFYEAGGNNADYAGVPVGLMDD